MAIPILCRMAAEQLKAFVSAMQAGIDVLKFSRGPPRMLFSRTVFIDKEVSRLCWLPTGRYNLYPKICVFVGVAA